MKKLDVDEEQFPHDVCPICQANLAMLTKTICRRCYEEGLAPVSTGFMCAEQEHV